MTHEQNVDFHGKALSELITSIFNLTHKINKLEDRVLKLEQEINGIDDISINVGDVFEKKENISILITILCLYDGREAFVEMTNSGVTNAGVLSFTYIRSNYTKVPF